MEKLLEHRAVYFLPTNDSLDSIYGNWGGGFIMLPKGLSGEELLALKKQTKAEKEECIKRGAE